MWLMFVVSSMVYYGLSVSAVSLNVDPFVYMVLSGLMEMPSYTLTAPIISKWGRRLPTALGYALCGAVMFALTFTPKGGKPPQQLCLFEVQYAFVHELKDVNIWNDVAIHPVGTMTFQIFILTFGDFEDLYLDILRKNL